MARVVMTTPSVAPAPERRRTIAASIVRASPIVRPQIDRIAARMALFFSAALLAFAALALLGLFSSGAARAQDPGLPDPTQPPAAMLAPKLAEVPSAAPAGPVLQSVVISEQRRGAVISGQYVALGGAFRDARLTQVSESGVELRGPSGTQVLPLYPAVQWQPASGVAPAAGQTAVPAKAARRDSNTARKRREGKGNRP